MNIEVPDQMVCEQCGRVIPPYGACWLNRATGRFRHPICRPLPMKMFQPRDNPADRPDGKSGRRRRVPDAEGSTALDIAEACLDLEDLQAAKVYAQVAIARAITEFMVWMRRQEEERWMDTPEEERS